MSGTPEAVWKHRDALDQAYVLKSGQVHFGIGGERHTLTGTNMLVGADEFLLAWDSKAPVFRIYDFYKDPDSELVPVPPVNLRTLLPRYSIGFALGQHLARMVLLTNRILRERQKNEASADTEVYNQNAKVYYAVTHEVEEIGEKFRFPPILQLVDKLKNELIYEAGRIHSAPEKTLFDVGRQKGGAVALAHGTVLCEEGQEGDELFILNQGAIVVTVGGRKVATIDEKGSVIGEIALFLGEKRTATLKTEGATSITRLDPKNLKEFSASNPVFFETLCRSIAKRVRNNFTLIRDHDRKKEPPSAKVVIPAFLLGKPGEDKLAYLFQELNNIYKFKRYEQVKAVLDKHKVHVTKYCSGR